MKSSRCEGNARSNEVNTNPTASSRNLVLESRLSSRSNYTESFRVLDRDSEFDLGFNLRNTRVREDGRRVQNEGSTIADYHELNDNLLSAKTPYIFSIQGFARSAAHVQTRYRPRRKSSSLEIVGLQRLWIHIVNRRKIKLDNNK
uniref:Uncharacterized protein n=1 Tax=Vespula pensylvanica TaxID=30213 RepID=A0A834UAE9_VESPE|nr:hypothetical protein H0235_008075 [Vespula pensylvanica]